MKQTALLTILITLCALGFSRSQYDTIIPVKTYHLRKKISVKHVVKITIDNEYSFIINRKPFLKQMSKTYSFLDQYKDMGNDTLFINFYNYYQSVDNKIISSMSIKKGPDLNVVSYSDTCEYKPDFSIFSFYHNSCLFIVQKALPTKRIAVFNEKSKTYETKIIKAKYSYSLDGWAAGAGIVWIIKPGGFVIFRKVKWVS